MNGWKRGCCSKMVVLVWLQSVPNIFICGNYQKTWNWGDCYWSGMYEWCYGLYSSQQHRRRFVGFGETYSNLFQITEVRLMDIEILWNLLHAKKEYVPPCLEFYFDIYGSLDGAIVKKKDLAHSNVLMVWSVLYHDKKNLKYYGGEF